MKVRLLVIVTNEKKLGDAIIAFNAVKIFLEDLNTSDRVILLVRRGYHLLAKDLKVRRVLYVGGFDRGVIISLLSKLYRLTLINISGEGKGLKKVFDNRSLEYYASRVRDYSYDANGVVRNFEHKSNFEYTWGPLSFFSQRGIPDCVKGLITPNNKSIKDVIMVNPFSAEKRKDIPLDALRKIVSTIQESYSAIDLQINVIVRSKSEKNKIRNGIRMPGVEVVVIGSLKALLKLMGKAKYIYTSDTGVYPLAVSLGIPVTVYFGPTQPEKCNYCYGSATISKLRLSRLGELHCNNKTCGEAVCISELVNVSEKYTYPKKCIARSLKR